jgi:hypothetical protein
MSQISSIKRFITAPYYVFNFAIIASYFIVRQLDYFDKNVDMLSGDDLTGIPRVKTKKIVLLFFVLFM